MPEWRIKCNCDIVTILILIVKEAKIESQISEGLYDVGEVLRKAEIFDVLVEPLTSIHRSLLAIANKIERGDEDIPRMIEFDEDSGEEGRLRIYSSAISWANPDGQEAGWSFSVTRWEAGIKILASIRVGSPTVPTAIQLEIKDNALVRFGFEDSVTNIVITPGNNVCSINDTWTMGIYAINAANNLAAIAVNPKNPNLELHSQAVVEA